MTSAFLQIPVDPASREYTAFSIGERGQFQFKRMPFGLTNSPSTFQEFMDQLIHSMPDGAREHVFAYLDDLCVVTETIEEHFKWLEIVLRTLYNAGLETNPDKSAFCVSEIKYLGYIVDSRGLRTDPEKVEAIVNFPSPKNTTQLRRVLGMIGWFARYLPDFANLKLPLCDLLKKNVAYEWGPAHEEAFQRIKESLCSAPILIRPDFSKPFELHTDASEYAIGAVLIQEFEKEKHPIIFINRLLTATERKYSVSEKECLAVLWSVEKLRHYLEGFSFTVFTDHHSLVWMQTLKNPSGRLTRWAMSLLAHDIKIEHRPGSENQVPDALSRAFENFVCAARDAPFTQDPWYLHQLEKVRRKPEKYPDWRIHLEKLHVHRPNSRIDPLTRDLNAWKFVVPKELRKQALEESHNCPTSGHVGTDKTYDLLSRRYYWQGMFMDCAKFVRYCLICQKNKIPPSGPQGLMDVREYERPWTTVSADCQGPFPTSSNNNNYLMVAQDIFTKYVVVKPIRSANGPAFWKALQEKVFLTFGYPKFLLVDNGTECDNNFMREQCAKNGITLNTVAPYHPQANPTERSNKTLKTMIRSFLKENHKKWDEYIQEFAFAMNNTVQDSTKFTPFFLNFGRNPDPPSVLAHEQLPVTRIKRTDPIDWADHVSRLEAYHEIYSARQASRLYNITNPGTMSDSR